MSNGPIQFKSARKIWPVLELLRQKLDECSLTRYFATTRGSHKSEFFLIGPKDLKKTVLTNLGGFVFRSHIKLHDKAKFLCKH